MNLKNFFQKTQNFNEFYNFIKNFFFKKRNFFTNFIIKKLKF